MDKRVAIVIAAVAIAASITLTLSTFDAALNTPVTNTKLGLVINSPTTAPTLVEIRDIYLQAASAGIGRSNVYVFWDSIEPKKGEYDWKQSDILMSLNKNSNLRVTLYFSIINGNTLGPFPGWLESPGLTTLDRGDIVSVLDAILQRYHIIDYVIIAGQTEEHFRYNEHDIPAYAKLFDAVYADLKELHPDVKFGNVFSLHNTLNKDLQHIVTELDGGDFVGFIYFPVDSLNDIVRTPEQARSDLDEALRLAGGKPVAFLEAGWSTSDFVGGTPEDQRLFVLHVSDFYATNADDIEFITWHLMHDRPAGSCVPDLPEEAVSIGGSSDLGSSHYVLQRLDSYLCNSGLIYENGTHKPGWDEFAASDWSMLQK